MIEIVSFTALVAVLVCVPILPLVVSFREEIENRRLSRMRDELRSLDVPPHSKCSCKKCAEWRRKERTW